MKNLPWILIGIFLFFASCTEKNEIQNFESEPLTKIEGQKKSSSQSLLKFKSPKEGVSFLQQGCDPNVFDIDEGIVWEYACYDEFETPGYTPATDLLNQYFKSCIGILSESPNQNCDNLSSYYVYEENRVVDDCPDLIPFTFLEFNSTCYPCPNSQGTNYNISSDELLAFGDFLMGQALASVPPGYEIMGLDALYTEWYECTHLQKYFECELRDPQPNNILGCNEGYLDDYCDSACRYCESRRIVLELFYRKCTPEVPPTSGECEMTVTLLSTKADGWNIIVSGTNDGGNTSYIGEICSGAASCNFPIPSIGGSVNIPITSDCRTYYFYSSLAPVTIMITTPAGSNTVTLLPNTFYSTDLSCAEIPCP